MAPTKNDTNPKEDKRGAHLRLPDNLKKPQTVYVPTGKPRGRAPGQKNKKTIRAEMMREAMPKSRSKDKAFFCKNLFR